jgi:hypothetical protein
MYKPKQEDNNHQHKELNSPLFPPLHNNKMMIGKNKKGKRRER